jgi:hypothetical protein
VILAKVDGNELVVLQMPPGSGAPQRLISFPIPAPLQTFSAQRLSVPTDPTSWVAAPPLSLKPFSSDYLARFSWARPNLGTGANLAYQLDVAF